MRGFIAHATSPVSPPVPQTKRESIGRGGSPVSPSVPQKRSEDGAYPLQERPWLRLFLIVVSCAVCTGVMPGAPLFVRLFVEAGVGGALCGAGAAAGGGCDEQHLFVSEAFNGTMSVAILAGIAGGILFDRLGGNSISKVGALIVCMGFILMQVPLLGAYYGRDEQTSGLLVWALILLDCGSTMNSFSLFSMAWHLPKYQTFVAACAQASTSATAFLPVLMSTVMKQTGLPLHFLFLLWLVLAALACVACHVLVPTSAEFRAQAKKTLGFPPPRGAKASVWCALKDAHASLGMHSSRHLLFGLALCACLNSVLVYSALISDYARLMFKSAEAGHDLLALATICSGFAGCVLAPVTTLLADRWGSGNQVMAAVALVLSAVQTACVGSQSLLWQEAAAVAGAAFLNFYTVLTSKYCMKYAMPHRFGAVSSVITWYLILGVMPLMALAYLCFSSLPSSSLDHFRVPLQLSSLLGTAMLLVWVENLCNAGLPETPVMLPKDEEELRSSGFGCTNFDQVALATGTTRDEVGRRLSSSNPNDIKDLVSQMDWEDLERMSCASRTRSIDDNGSSSSSSCGSSSSSSGSSSGSSSTSSSGTSSSSVSSSTPQSTQPSPAKAKAPAQAAKEDKNEDEEAPAKAKAPAKAPPKAAKEAAAVVEAQYGSRPPGMVFGPAAGEVTLCAVSCYSGSSGAGQSQSSKRFSWSGSSVAALFGCCAADPRSQILPASQVPLLQQRQQEHVHPKKKARVLNEKMMEMLRASDKEGLVRVYMTEDPKVLYEAYLDMYDMFDEPTLEQIGEEFDELLPQEEMLKFPLKRPELRVFFAKVLAHRKKKETSG